MSLSETFIYILSDLVIGVIWPGLTFYQVSNKNINWGKSNFQFN